MKILFICTHNRCRSVLCEAITNHVAAGKIRAYSAGSQPAGEIHPWSIKYLRERKIPCEGMKSQSWDDYEWLNPDIVITVCDSAASEVCPLWFGNSVQVHWGLSDPSKLEGSERDIRTAFFALMDVIEARIKRVLTLDFAKLDQARTRYAFLTIAREVS